MNVVRLGELHSGQVRSGQVRSGQVRSGQVRSEIVKSLIGDLPYHFTEKNCRTSTIGLISTKLFKRLLLQKNCLFSNTGKNKFVSK
jgi:hypothetical protein